MKNLSFEHKNNRFELKLLTHGAQCCTGCRKILRKSRKTVKLLLDPPMLTEGNERLDRVEVTSCFGAESGESNG